MNTINTQAAERLEKTRFLRKIKAEMKANVIETLVSMEENNELPKDLKVKRYTPNDETADALSYIGEFCAFHNLTNTLKCLRAETNGDIMVLRTAGNEKSKLARAIEIYNQKKAAEAPAPEN
ncbi:hypothetical protein TVAG_319420 [Trichomonas vaginalis G3]|uniref:LisH domain-containing protein n=1 Tax=Trichomonas vaginalis (strain ATCC PRA-98 / G3) TaxID=412133 RepID=A2DQ90_TRIV3|nr:hypothetical protein TVAGG3_1009210 [Trichomonas vaginalis G3]EAY17347.1 hypothetical protein TVAG_319420 [Trichomonas vaginalis G3]KAI5491355.1 hypothetical protein TVAGG3_1009210 [Trichomonas vaginalis G3]|eukprot:XP_001330716.1 hypothetical protein [Trichomonas vaginalis G3]